MPGGRPSKPLALVQGHRTKAEKAVRKEAEEQLITGYALREWDEVKKNPIAHERFQRVRKLLKKINKDDALFEPVINRYCLLMAEGKEFEDMKLRLYEELKELGQAYHDGQIEFMAYLENKNKLQDKLFSCDKKIMEKRKAMLDIEKENILTIASALRSIPKTPEKKQQSKMAAMHEKRQAK
jgi:coenzyme F420-reducing hydrogenase delta subunit